MHANYGFVKFKVHATNIGNLTKPGFLRYGNGQSVFIWLKGNIPPNTWMSWCTSFLPFQFAIMDSRSMALFSFVLCSLWAAHLLLLFSCSVHSFWRMYERLDFYNSLLRFLPVVRCIFCFIPDKNHWDFLCHVTLSHGVSQHQQPNSESILISQCNVFNFHSSSHTSVNVIFLPPSSLSNKELTCFSVSFLLHLTPWEVAARAFLNETKRASIWMTKCQLCTSSCS